jgi:hypothetical protein
LLVASYAPSNAQSSSPKPATADDIRARGADWLKQCLQDWDATTHMSKGEWQTTCRRVVDDRVKWLFDQAKTN